jgi:alkanesulfonate monooxygenase SsuD/methylene tetrahydromethanopterin reductase-like flavin-dependent oxidoreductase (luciferase family)
MNLSFLDLVPVIQGGTVARSLANAADLAAHAEALGYRRYWVAEHHGMAGIASAATAVVIAHIGQATRTIRIGAGGIMLPNHAPLQVAEQFGTLDALFPGRIDLGLGRAPGSDQRVAHALRRTLDTDPNAFPNDVVELQSYFADDGRTGIAATPGAGAKPELWILGSSLFGAQLAAIAADTAEEAELLSSSQAQSFVALRTGNPGRMPPPVPGYRDSLGPQGAAMLNHVLRCSSIGTAETVARDLAAFVRRTGVDEVMVASAIYDHDARKHSLRLTAEAVRAPALAA